MIKKVLIVPYIFLLTLLSAGAKDKKQTSYNPYQLQPGDIVFQGGNDLQARAVKAATHSRWSHVGLVFFHQGAPWVLEAAQPVKTTPLREFISRNPSEFYAMRLKNAGTYLTPKAMRKAEALGKQMIGTEYDSHFQWSNEKLYCSELVWKIYNQATGLKLCPPHRVTSYDLHQPAMLKLIKQRFGSIKKLPKNELMVSPGDIARSELLTEAPRKDQLTSRR